MIMRKVVGGVSLLLVLACLILGVYGLVKVVRAQPGPPPVPVDVGIPGVTATKPEDPQLQTNALLTLAGAGVGLVVGVVGCVYGVRKPMVK